MKTTSKGFRKYDPNDANDKASNVAKWIADDSTYNMDLLDSQLVEYDEKIKNASNVTLNGERKQNFNFIENKVVQDGLIDNRYNIDMNRNNVNPYVGYYISYSYDNLRDLNMFYIDFTGITSGTCFYVQDYNINNNVIISIPYSNLVDRGFLVTININKILNLLEIKFQDGYTVTKNILSTYKFSFFGNSVGNYGCLGKINSFWYYSRTLTAQEIQHNFSVLNNSPSIKELHTTDSAGKTSILPTLYKESKKARGTLIEIPYDEPRDLENYIYKFI